MSANGTALVIIDMQRYYLSTASPFYRYFSDLSPGCMDYIAKRCADTTVPAITMLLGAFRAHGAPVVYCRLCGADPERRDLHRFFRDTYVRARAAGYDNVYPLAGDPLAEIDRRIAPRSGEAVFTKTTFSAFASTDIDARLRARGVDTLVFAGLATSQCVETTARDASDRGFGVVHVADAQADYSEETHCASLYSSQGVCGGDVVDAAEYLARRGWDRPADDRRD